MIRVAIVDDQPLARSGLRSIIESEPDMTVVGEAGNGAEGVTLIRASRPDIAIMDLRMPILDGIAATTQVVADTLDTQILVITTFDDDELVYRALQAGASGFLLKDSTPEQMITAIRTVRQGHAILAPEITRAVIARYAANNEPVRTVGVALDSLTEREHEIVVLVAQGLSNREIGHRLFVSEGTVKTHVSNILTKTGLHSRVQIVALAYEAGFIRPSG
jgi:DNA-binding NarL/FixJ family response regulator